MKVSKLLGERFKNAPSDCLIESHKLMVRGGYMKYMANGIYSLFMPTRRITRKIENIIREEMDNIDGQEGIVPGCYACKLVGRIRQILQHWQ